MASSKSSWSAKPIERSIETTYYRLTNTGRMFLAVGVFLNRLSIQIRAFDITYKPSKSPNLSPQVTYIPTKHGCRLDEAEFTALSNFAPEINRFVGGTEIEPDVGLQVSAAEEMKIIGDGVVVRQQLTPVQTHAPTYRSGYPVQDVKRMTWAELLSPDAAAAAEARYPSLSGEKYVMALCRDTAINADIKSAALTRSEWIGLQKLFGQALQQCKYIEQLCIRWGLQIDTENHTDSILQTSMNVDTSTWIADRVQAHILLCLYQVLDDYLCQNRNVSEETIQSFAGHLQHGDVFRLATAGRADRQNFAFTDAYDLCTDILDKPSFQNSSLINWYRSFDPMVVLNTRDAVQTGTGILTEMMVGRNSKRGKKRTRKPTEIPKTGPPAPPIVKAKSYAPSIDSPDESTDDEDSTAPVLGKAHRNDNNELSHMMGTVVDSDPL